MYNPTFVLFGMLWHFATSSTWRPRWARDPCVPETHLYIIAYCGHVSMKLYYVAYAETCVYIYHIEILRVFGITGPDIFTIYDIRTAANKIRNAFICGTILYSVGFAEKSCRRRRRQRRRFGSRLSCHSLDARYEKILDPDSRRIYLCMECVASAGSMRFVVFSIRLPFLFISQHEQTRTHIHILFAHSLHSVMLVWVSGMWIRTFYL